MDSYQISPLGEYSSFLLLLINPYKRIILTFRGPCTMMYIFVIKANKMQYFLNLFW